MSSIHSFGVTMPSTPYVQEQLMELGFESHANAIHRNERQLYVSLISMSFISTNTFIRGKREITYDDLRCLLLINDLEGQFAYMRSEGLAYLVNNKLHSEIPF